VQLAGVVAVVGAGHPVERERPALRLHGPAHVTQDRDGLLVAEVVEDPLEQVRVAAGRYALEEVAADHLAPVGDPALLQYRDRVRSDVRQVQQNAAHLRERRQQPGHELAGAAAQIDERADGAPVVCRDDRAHLVLGHAPDLTVEPLPGLGVRVEVFPVGQAVHGREPVHAVPHGVVEDRPRLQFGAEHLVHAAYRVRVVRPQQLRGGREREPPDRRLHEQALPGERAQHPVQRGRVRAGQLRQLLDRTGHAAAEVVGHTQVADHPEGDRRDVVAEHGQVSYRSRVGPGHVCRHQYLSPVW
jgi:hypothetical protein